MKFYFLLLFLVISNLSYSESNKGLFLISLCLNNAQVCAVQRKYNIEPTCPQCGNNICTCITELQFISANNAHHRIVAALLPVRLRLNGIVWKRGNIYSKSNHHFGIHSYHFLYLPSVHCNPRIWGNHQQMLLCCNRKPYKL